MIRYTYDAAHKDPAAAQQIKQMLEAGGVVVFPTETVYGIGALASSQAGVEKVRKLKGLEVSAPLAIHLPNAEQATKLLSGQHPSVIRFANKVWPGPVALQVQTTQQSDRPLTEAVKAGGETSDGTAVTSLIRVPDDAVAQWLLHVAGGPIMAVAAGALDADEAAKRWDGKVDILIDHGRARYGKPSTMVQIEPAKLPESAPQGMHARPVFKVSHGGVFDERYIHKLLRYTLLVVCSGNTCRSPMAAGLARQYIAQLLGLPMDELEAAGVRVTSAGTSADVGSQASINAVSVMAQRGVDISKHRATQLTYDMIIDADMILCMTRSHMAQVLKTAPRAQDKTFLLDSNHNDIQDPYGQTEHVYEQAARQIQTGLKARLDETF